MHRRSRSNSIARGDDDRSAEMSARSGRRRGGAARPRRRRAGEQNAADMRDSGADADGHRRRPGNEIGDGEYARSHARPADAREPRAADEVDALRQDGAPVGFQPRHRAVAGALLIGVKEIGIIAHRRNPRDRKSFGRPFVLGPRQDDEVARLEIGEAVAKRRAGRQRDDARLRDRRGFEGGRQRPARPGLRPQPAEPARDRPTVCLRQNHADMRTLFRLRRQRVEAAPIRRPATRLAPRLVAFERRRHERAAEMALGQTWLADQAKAEGEQRMARAPSARQTLGKRNLTQPDDAESEWTRPIGRRDPDRARLGGDLAEPDRPAEQRPRQDFLLHVVRRQAAQQRARERIDETRFVSQLDPAIGGDPARELQPQPGFVRGRDPLSVEADHVAFGNERDRFSADFVGRKQKAMAHPCGRAPHGRRRSRGGRLPRDFIWPPEGAPDEPIPGSSGLSNTTD